MRTPTAVLIVQPAALGDVLLSATLLDDLHREAPGARLDFLTSAAAAPLLIGHPLVSRQLDFTRRMRTDIRTMRSGKYDLIVDPSTTPRTALLTVLSGVPVRVGYDVRPPRSYAYTHRVARDPQPPLYSALDRKRLLDAVGIHTEPSLPRIFLSAGEREHGRAALEKLIPAASRGKPIVGITMSAGLGRNWWNPRHWAAVAAGVRQAGGIPVILMGPADEPKLAAFHDAAGTAIVALHRPLRDFLGLLAHCAVLASPDTGPAHMAQALGVATVTLYVKGRAAVWNPGTPRAVALEAPLTFRCPECELPSRQSRRVVHSCLSSIEAGTVVRAISELLATNRS